MKRVTKRQKQVALMVRLMPFPAHELDWLCKHLEKAKTDVIEEAIILTAAYWRNQKEMANESTSETHVD